MTALQVKPAAAPDAAQTLPTGPDPQVGKDLRARWADYRSAHPRAFTRDAAAALGVSEAELLSTGCGADIESGTGVERLAGDMAVLLLRIPSLGEVKTITRNETAVIERKGRYERVEISGRMGQVVGEEIDLRLFLDHWATCFAVREEGPRGIRRSLQFFDRQGDSIHKVYLEDPDRVPAYDALCAAYRSDDQRPGFQPSPPPPHPEEQPDGEIDTAGLREAWDALTDVHGFFGLLRRFGVTRTQALRLGGPERARPVSPTILTRALTSAAADALPIMIFVGSRGAIQIHTGPIARVETLGAWLNILDPRFNLHVRTERLAQAWVVRKPTEDGPVTSLELFDAAGETVAYLFGKRKPGQPESTAWRDLLAAAEPTP
ncbi:hemin-degrading factor [Chondromyces apiculatus]|uniref:Hemin transport protein HmuS n=1 Tax=Chondromyces apiculatus DSM 436 TaxID=1192034 RepID=A0A017SYI6_9BACT|nr:ChuX/HutX family heme-like substrate-binding protein [Chondromyces apiculatus]EYF01675.1 Hemin transport protein HmuS [Chondromyces apiculatus DSM 436]